MPRNVFLLGLATGAAFAAFVLLLYLPDQTDYRLLQSRLAEIEDVLRGQSMEEGRADKQVVELGDQSRPESMAARLGDLERELRRLQSRLAWLEEPGAAEGESSQGFRDMPPAQSTESESAAAQDAFESLPEGDSGERTALITDSFYGAVQGMHLQDLQCRDTACRLVYSDPQGRLGALGNSRAVEERFLDSLSADLGDVDFSVKYFTDELDQRVLYIEFP